MLQNLCLLAAAAALSCGASRPPAAFDGGSESYALSLVGPGSLTVHPGDKRTLQVLFTKDGAGPVRSAAVRFEFQDGDPAGATLDAADVTTDDAGIAAVNFTAGAANQSFRVVASAPKYAADPIGYSLDVVPLRVLLQIVASPGTTVAGDGASAGTTLAASSSVSLRVRAIDADTGAALSGDVLAFSLPEAGANAALFWNSDEGATAVVRTGAGGEAQALLGARHPGGPWMVSAQSKSGGSPVMFSVTVQGAAGSCTADADCPSGDKCVSGVCKPPVTTKCDPSAADCPPDLTGLWQTRHDFSIREALPTTIQDVFKGIRLLDQALVGKLTLPGLPSWLQNIINSFLRGLLHQYLPLWLQDVIQLSDDVATIFSNLRAEGSMRLSRGSDALHLRGSEVWPTLVFYWLPLCNGAIGGDPSLPPDCARIEVATSDSSAGGSAAQCKGQMLPQIKVQLAPFTAALAKQNDAYSLAVDPRHVSLEMSKVMLVLVDQLLSILTPYHCLEEATSCTPGGSCLVDCAGLGQDIGSATGGLVSASTIETLCDGAVIVAGEAATKALADAWPVSADALDFSGAATVATSRVDPALCDLGTNGNCAAQLGNDDYDRNLNSADATARQRRDGAWEGDFFFKLAHKLPGAWEAKRPH